MNNPATPRKDYISKVKSSMTQERKKTKPNDKQNGLSPFTSPKKVEKETWTTLKRPR